MAKDKIGKQQQMRLDLGQIGSTGLDHQAGLIFEEFLPQLQGLNGIEVFTEMSENDPVVGGVLRAIDLLIRQVDWRFEPFDDTEEDISNADFMESVIGDMSDTWQDTVSEILSMLVFGWSYHEIVYKMRQGDNRDPSKRSKFNDGRIGLRKMPIRSQDSLFRWRFGEDGSIEGMEQQPPPDFNLRFIPIEKSLLFRTKVHKGSPEGKSILRNAYRPWFFKKHIENIEGVGIERDLAGLPIAYVPPEILSPDASADEKSILNEIKNIVRNVRRDEQEGIVFPQAFDEDGNRLYDFSLLTSGGRRQFDTDAIVQRYDQRIAMTVLADFILLGADKTGSFALSSDKTRLFAQAIGAWLDSIAATINRHLTPKLFRFNNLPTDRIPKITHSGIESIPLDVLGSYISNLSGAGAPLFPDDDLEDFLRQAAGLPKRGATNETL